MLFDGLFGIDRGALADSIRVLARWQGRRPGANTPYSWCAFDVRRAHRRILMLFVKPLALMIMRQPGDNGIGYFVVRIFLHGLVIVGWLGPPIFELARWLGNRAKNPVTDERI
jgi:hypothetical protein